MDTLPPLSSDLVKALAKEHPAPHITPETSRDRLMYEAGARHVVEKLLKLSDSTPPPRRR